jgi:hypothetical protein
MPTCYHRTGYGTEPNHYEFCLSTLGDPSYFLYVLVTDEQMEKARIKINDIINKV